MKILVAKVICLGVAIILIQGCLSGLKFQPVSRESVARGARPEQLMAGGDTNRRVDDVRRSVLSSSGYGLHLLGSRCHRTTTGFNDQAVSINLSCEDEYLVKFQVVCLSSADMTVPIPLRYKEVSIDLKNKGMSLANGIFPKTLFTNWAGEVQFSFSLKRNTEPLSFILGVDSESIVVSEASMDSPIYFGPEACARKTK